MNRGEMLDEPENSATACPRCGGLGFVDAVTCAKCRGLGEISYPDALRLALEIRAQEQLDLRRGK